MFELDHIVMSTRSLDIGVADISLPWGPGGQHAAFGTHNKLLGLGTRDYLELIAIDPVAASPAWPRWYGLDDFDGETRVTNWVVRTDDMDAALTCLGAGYGPEHITVHDVARGGLRWKMAVPKSGHLPFDNCGPAVIQWLTPPPMAALPGRGWRLKQLDVHHPQARELEGRIGQHLDQRMRFTGGAPALKARLLGGDQRMDLPC